MYFGDGVLQLGLEVSSDLRQAVLYGHFRVRIELRTGASQMISNGKEDELCVFLPQLQIDVWHQKKEAAVLLAKEALAAYLCIRAHLVFFRIFLYLCLRIFLRRFFTTDDIQPPWFF